MKRNLKKTRLFINDSLGVDNQITLTSMQSHYLMSVMRLQPGDMISVFNGKDGQWLAELTSVHKKSCQIKIHNCELPQKPTPKLSLLFSPIKSESAGYIVQKATELGATSIFPTLTQRSVVRNVNQDKLNLSAIEAAEQCERLDVPAIHPIANLNQVLGAKEFTGSLILCDETLHHSSTLSKLRNIPHADNAILIGPEGGFSPEELALLHQLPYVLPISLGKRILRAETAIVAALSVYQAIADDW